MNKVTVRRSIQIGAPPNAVWDYTQDWRRRHEWDRSVVKATYLSEAPPVVVQVEGKGGLRFKVSYKMRQRPHLTSLVMTDLDSFWVTGGGGSWKYKDDSLDDGAGEDEDRATNLTPGRFLAVGETLGSQLVNSDVEIEES